MHIKQVIIHGFKSYRDTVIVEPFSKGHNVVVGRNGSGKSNFFFAIRFVLDGSSILRTEERQTLLHEGTGAAVMSAYVELVFDNSDGRLPIEKEEVTLRRAIGLKKDEFFLNGKHITKSDHMNMLESAGFSRSNPYYIVQQGKIQQLTVAKDSERLQLLKEVAGTSVYEDRRRESEKIMRETDGRLATIDQVLVYIDERLSELDAEQKELKEYQELDRSKRSLEYTVYSKELTDIDQRLEQINQSYAAETTQAQEKDKETEALQEEISQMEGKVREIMQERDLLVSRRQQMESDRLETIKVKTHTELELKDLDQRKIDDKAKKDEIEKQLKEVEQLIKNTQKRLEEVAPVYETALEKDQSASRLLALSEQRLSDLHTKQGRKGTFKTKKERDAYLTNQIQELEDAITSNQSQITSTERDIRSMETTIADDKAYLKENDNGVQGQRKEIEFLKEELTSRQTERNTLANKQKDIWRKQQEIETRLVNCTADLRKSEQTLHSTMSKNHSHALKSVMQLVKDHGIEGVYGPLIEQFTCQDIFNTAVEVTAGNSLLNIVVDNEGTASNILSLMSRNRVGGRVTFMPLANLHNSPQNYPSSEDAFPLVQRIQYDPVMLPAMMQVFGRTLVARNLDAGRELAVSAQLDCITLDGDQVSRRGAFTGGYNDRKRSRMEAMRVLKEARDTMNLLVEERQKLEDEAVTIGQRITLLTGELQQLDADRKRQTIMFEDIQDELDQRKERICSSTRNLDMMRPALVQLQSQLAVLEQKNQSLKMEINTPLTSQLSKDEQAEMEELTNQIASLRQESRECTNLCMKLETDKNQLENDLNSNLIRRQGELIQSLSTLGATNQSLIQDKIDALDLLGNEIENMAGQMEAFDGEIKDLIKQVAEGEKEIEKAQRTVREQEQLAEEERQARQRIMSKRTVLVREKEQVGRRIREIGFLPANAMERYREYTLKQLRKELGRVNEGLKAFSSVNKKALDQYKTFSDQRESLVDRREDMQRSKDAIKELIDHLDQQKDEAIERTFQQVANHFSKIFSRLTRTTNGNAKLVMITGDRGDDSDDDITANKKMGSRVDQYTGVSIKVSFTGRIEDMHEVQQLSGGQKSLVALALIFAIQQSDPAPFYLFDEIDSALDDAYRTAVADMIYDLSHDEENSAQFITTTFHPEMLQRSDRYYGITFRNKISRIDCIDKEEALDFVSQRVGETRA